jgi:hypothetical protein
MTDTTAQTAAARVATEDDDATIAQADANDATLGQPSTPEAAPAGTVAGTSAATGAATDAGTAAAGGRTSAGAVQSTPAAAGVASPSGGVGTAAATSPAAEAALFDATATKDLQSRWQVIQVAFVDEPRGAVQQADQLVDEVLTKLQESFGRERQELERAWSGGNEASTEDLRQAIRRYRSFFNRLLSI